MGARLEGDEQQSAADADADHPLASGAEGASSPDLSLSGLDPPLQLLALRCGAS